MAGPHHSPRPAFEFEDACYPALKLKLPLYLLMVIVKTAAIAHQGSTGGRCDQCAERRYTILEGHESKKHQFS
jgi:hypothetical protein